MTGEEEDLVTLTPYDFHANVRVSGHDVVKEDFGKRIASVRDTRERYGWNVIDRASGDIVMRQSGVFRVNVSRRDANRELSNKEANCDRRIDTVLSVLIGKL